MIGTGVLSSALLLDAWEHGGQAPEAARGAVVLATVSGLAADGLVDVPLAEVSRLAARCLHETFGDDIEIVLGCGGCGERLEVSVPAAGLDRRDAPRHEAAKREEPSAPVRAPTVRDLVAAVGSDDPARTMLLRCLTGTPATADDGDWDALAAALDHLADDALSDLVATCPSCGSRVEGVLDPGALLWDAVADAAPHLVREVAALAAAFGWSEPEILSLSPSRRAAYLELVGG